jgi:hypothetical protein
VPQAPTHIYILLTIGPLALYKLSLSFKIKIKSYLNIALYRFFSALTNMKCFPEGKHRVYSFLLLKGLGPCPVLLFISMLNSIKKINNKIKKAYF